MCELFLFLANTNVNCHSERAKRVKNPYRLGWLWSQGYFGSVSLRLSPAEKAGQVMTNYDGT